VDGESGIEVALSSDPRTKENRANFAGGCGVPVAGIPVGLTYLRQNGIF